MRNLEKVWLCSQRPLHVYFVSATCTVVSILLWDQDNPFAGSRSGLGDFHVRPEMTLLNVDVVRVDGRIRYESSLSRPD